ncbi:MAG: GNAT family N-acetyltransferase [Hyphomicrobiales bacterium]
MRRVKTTVTYLEMKAEPRLHYPPPVNLKLMLMRAEQPSVGFYRYLYDAVGRDFLWVDRKKINDRKLLATIRAAGVQVWVLYVAGVPAGYFEVDARDKSAVELQYLGLIPEFHGHGLGKWFMAEAIKACWAHKPEKVVVETCTLDSPAALPLYQRMGFVPYARKEKVMEISD